MKGIGVDIVHVPRMEENMLRFGVRFLEKVLHPEERTQLESVSSQAHFLAKRFAAKEAFAKALGTGFREALTMPRIWVDHQVLGQPVLRWEDEVQSFLDEQGVSMAHLSLSDENAYAIAFVMVE